MVTIDIEKIRIKSDSVISAHANKWMNQLKEEMEEIASRGYKSMKFHKHRIMTVKKKLCFWSIPQYEEIPSEVLLSIMQMLSQDGFQVVQCRDDSILIFW